MELWVIHPKLNTVNPTCLNTWFLSAANFDSTLFKFVPKTVKHHINQTGKYQKC